MKKKVGILFGGKSAEHEVSLQSAKNIYEAIDRTRFEPVLVGIDKTGRWLLNDASRFLLNADNPERISLNTEGRAAALQAENRGLLAEDGGGRFSAVSLDVVFPVLHGPFGEDGTIQGFLKLADIPFVGAGVMGSAAGMDKDVMKRLLRDAEIPIGKFIAVKSHEQIPAFAEVVAALGNPVFIKPANMGSSVGISKVRQEGEYTGALKDAFQYDSKVIIEEFIPGREIECAVLGNEEPAASVPGEIIPSHDFYSYDAKYLDENGAALKIPAELDEETKKQIQMLSVKTFQTLCCEGLSRVDFFLKENGEVIVNEINTMPGFTRISMYPKMWEASGVTYTELITRLIELAVSRFEKERLLKTSK
ncbi:MAG: D-alanine--D-alanine ligase [Treponema sp.]|jgi:D-alanine-D-alanine ligase|nr:D-alanine--D-alanine ligase [Treponema sp.]